MHAPYTEFGEKKKGRGDKKQRRAKDRTKIARNPIPVLKWLVKSERW